MFRPKSGSSSGQNFIKYKKEYIKIVLSELRCQCYIAYRNALQVTVLYKQELKWLHPVAQLPEALRYKTEGRGFDSRWCHCNFH